MSAILKVERLGASAKLFHLRGLAHQIGEDSRGVLVSVDPTKVLFSVVAQADKYLIQANTKNILIADRYLPSSELVELKECVEYTLDDYTFSFFFTSALAEVAATMPSAELEDHTDSLVPAGCISVTSSLALRQYPLFPHLTYTVGSAAENAIVIQSTKVEPRHCSLTLLADYILCRAVQGSFIVDGVSYNTSRDFSIPLKISLGSGLIVIDISKQWEQQK